MTRCLFYSKNGVLSGAIVITEPDRSPQVIPVNFKKAEPELVPDFEAKMLWAFSECVGCSPAELLRARAIINQ